MKKYEDERITWQIQKYGSEAFILITTLLFCSFFIKSFILDMDFKKPAIEFILLIIGCGYFAIRCIFGGAFSIPTKTNEKTKLRNQLIIGNIAFALLWGIAISIRNTFIYMDGSFNKLSIFVFIVSSLSALVLGSALSIIILAILRGRESRNHEE